MIYVCSLAELPHRTVELRPGYVVSMVGVAEQPDTPSGVPPERHHRVEIDDISQPLDGLVLPEVARAWLSELEPPFGEGLARLRGLDRGGLDAELSARVDRLIERWEAPR